MDDKHKYTVIFDGNTIRVPDYEKEREQRRKELERLKKIKQEELKVKRAKQKSIMAFVLVAFMMGMFSIYRYCTIYKMQRNLSQMNAQVTNLNRENETLDIQLLKFKNLQYIEDKATKEGMVKADRNIAVYDDLTKNNFKTPSTKNSTQMKNNIVEKVVDFIFR